MSTVVASSAVPVTRFARSKQPSIAAFHREHSAQMSGRLPVRSLSGFSFVSTEVAIVALRDAQAHADALWEGAVVAGAQWSARRQHVAALHTLVYQLLAELAGRRVRTVAIEMHVSGGGR